MCVSESSRLKKGVCGEKQKGSLHPFELAESLTLFGVSFHPLSVMDGLPVSNKEKWVKEMMGPWSR